MHWGQPKHHGPSNFKSMESDNRSKDGTSDCEDHLEHFISVEVPCHQRIFITLWEMPNTDKFDWISSPRISRRRTSLVIVRRGHLHVHVCQQCIVRGWG